MVANFNEYKAFSLLYSNKDSDKIRIFVLKIKTLKYAVANIQIPKRGRANVQ